MTILLAVESTDPQRGWGGPLGILVAGLVFWAFVWARGVWARRQGTPPSPTGPRAVGSRSNRQVTAGPHESSDRTEPGGPGRVLRQAWVALRTGNPRPDDEFEDDEPDETLDEFVARTYKAGDSDGDIIADAVDIYGVTAARVKQSLEYVRGEVVRASLGISRPAIQPPPWDVVDVPLDGADEPAEPEESFEKYVARRRLAGDPYTHIVRDAAAEYGTSESKVKRQITEVDREREPGRAA